MECVSAGGECPGQDDRADRACNRASDGDGGTRPRSKPGRGSAASPDHQSRLRQLWRAARIGQPPQSPRENHGADFSSRRSLDGSASFGHAIGTRPRCGFRPTFRSNSNERRDFHWSGFDGARAYVDRFAASLRARIVFEKRRPKNGRLSSSPHSSSCSTSYSTIMPA